MFTTIFEMCIVYASLCFKFEVMQSQELTSKIDDFNISWQVCLSAHFQSSD